MSVRCMGMASCYSSHSLPSLTLTLHNVASRIRPARLRMHFTTSMGHLTTIMRFVSNIHCITCLITYGWGPYAPRPPSLSFLAIQETNINILLYSHSIYLNIRVCSACSSSLFPTVPYHCSQCVPVLTVACSFLVCLLLLPNVTQCACYSLSVSLFLCCSHCCACCSSVCQFVFGVPAAWCSIAVPAVVLAIATDSLECSCLLILNVQCLIVPVVIPLYVYCCNADVLQHAC